MMDVELHLFKILQCNSDQHLPIYLNTNKSHLWYPVQRLGLISNVRFAVLKPQAG